MSRIERTVVVLGLVVAASCGRVQFHELRVEPIDAGDTAGDAAAPRDAQNDAPMLPPIDAGGIDAGGARDAGGPVAVDASVTPIDAGPVTVDAGRPTSGRLVGLVITGSDLTVMHLDPDTGVTSDSVIVPGFGVHLDATYDRAADQFLVVDNSNPSRLATVSFDGMIINTALAAGRIAIAWVISGVTYAFRTSPAFELVRLDRATGLTMRIAPIVLSTWSDYHFSMDRTTDEVLLGERNFTRSRYETSRLNTAGVVTRMSVPGTDMYALAATGAGTFYGYQFPVLTRETVRVDEATSVVTPVTTLMQPVVRRPYACDPTRGRVYVLEGPGALASGTVLETLALDGTSMGSITVDRPLDGIYF